MFVSLYDVAPDGMSKIPAIYPAHRERLNEFHRRGVLVAAGPLKGARGIVQHEPNGKRRLIVQIELLGRGVRHGVRLTRRAARCSTPAASPTAPPTASA